LNSSVPIDVSMLSGAPSESMVSCETSAQTGPNAAASAMPLRVVNRIIVWLLFQMQGRLSGPGLTQRYTAKHRPVRPFCATSFHWRPLCSAALRNERGEHAAQQAKARLKLAVSRFY
jgi:hypothetical protein